MANSPDAANARKLVICPTLTACSLLSRGMDWRCVLPESRDAASVPKLEHYDVLALIEEALAMDDVCDRNTCAAPTIHLLAHLLREATSDA